MTLHVIRVRKALNHAVSLISPHSFVAVLSQIAQMLCGFIVLRWVTPEQIGSWQALLVVEPYMGFLRLGVVNAMNRNYAFLMGAGRDQDAKRCVETTYAYTLLACIIEVIILLGLLIVWSRHAPVWFAGGVAFCFYAALSFYRNFLEATYRSSRDFKALSKVQLLSTTMSLATILLVVCWGFTGYMMRLFVVNIFSTALFWLLRPVRVLPLFNFGVFKKLVQDGLPLQINSWLTGISSSFFRILLLQAGGSMLLGRFSPIAALMGLGSMIPSTISVYLLPRLNFDFGSTGSVRKVVMDSVKATLLSFIVVIPFVLIGFFIIPPVLNWIAPSYQVTPLAVRLALLAILFSNLKLSANVFTVIGNWKFMYCNLATLLIVSWFGPWYGIRLFPDIPLEGALLGSLVGTISGVPLTTVLLVLSSRAQAKVIKHQK